MGLKFEPLGTFVQLVDERNSKMLTDDVLGISIDKYFMPSVANVIGTDLSKYKLLRKGRFACNPMHVGRDGRLPVAQYTNEIPAIVSPAYFMFEIIEGTSIEPEYLMFCFRQPSFDRMCWFRTDASVRGGITWDDVCALTIPIPSMEKQHKIVHDYYIITNRIDTLDRINNNLEEQLITIFKAWFVDYTPWNGIKPKSWAEGKLGDYVTIKRGGSPRPIQDYLTDKGFRWLKISDVTSIQSPYIIEIKEHIKEDGLNKTVHLNSGSLVLSNSATPGIPKILEVDSCIHDGWLYFPETNLSNEFLYLFFKHIRAELVKQGNGSIFTNLKTDILKNYNFHMPSKEILQKFDSIIKPYFNTIKSITKEKYILSNLLKTRLPHLMFEEG